MKNWTIERSIAKRWNTEALDDPEHYLKQLAELLVFPCYESDGQFTGGYYTVKYIYESMVYEFDYDDDNKLFDGSMYPEEFL